MADKKKAVPLFLAILLLLSTVACSLRSNPTIDYSFYFSDYFYDDNSQTSNDILQGESGTIGESDSNEKSDEKTTNINISETDNITMNTKKSSQITFPDIIIENHTGVTINATLPEANGKMIFNDSPDSKYMQIVIEKYKFNPKMLASVYSSPNTGQNYVFEFNGTKDSSGRYIRNQDTLRRVYLIDENDNIVSVAAAKSSERVNISQSENWISMEVLIKKMILPEIQEQLDKN